MNRTGLRILGVRAVTGMVTGDGARGGGADKGVATQGNRGGDARLG